MTKLAKAIAIGAATVLPMFAFASQTSAGTTEDFFGLIGVFQRIIGTLTPFIIGLAVLIILWGLFNYIAGAGDEEKRAQAKQYIIWGIIGLFVMVSIWGLVGIVSRTLDIQDASFTPPATVPCPQADQTFDPATGLCS